MVRGSFTRPPPRRTMASKVLIGCEGAKTEPLYFDGIRQHLRASTLEFVLVDVPGTDPLTIVDAVIARVAEAKRKKAWEPGDSAWAVFDGEEHQGTDGQRHRWNTAIQRAEAKGIELAVSNPCFELWYLLHFHDQQAALRRDAALKALKQNGRVPEYEKNLAMFGRLHVSADKSLTTAAVDRARALRAKCGDVGLERWRNPSTGVFRLVTGLLGQPCRADGDKE